MKRAMQGAGCCSHKNKRLCLGMCGALAPTCSAPQSASSTSGPTAPQEQQQHQEHGQLQVWQQQLQKCANMGSPGVLEQLLERALTDADAALHLTSSAMSLATHVCMHGSSPTADAALRIAEQALAATMHQLAVAQALVAHKADQQTQQQQKQQQLGWLEELQCDVAAAVDEDLQDTCNSRYVPVE